MDNLRVGAQGWQRKTWEGSFYPEEMPDDWQLDFYSNQFDCVLIPSVEWLNWTDEDIQEMNDALAGEAFAFYFRIDALLDAVAQQQLIKIQIEMDGLALGIVSFVPNLNLPEALQTGDLTYCVKADEEGGALSKKASWSWQWEDTLLYGSPVGFVRFLPKEAKGQTEMLRSFMASLPQNVIGLPFFVEDEKLLSEELVQLKTIAELLGF